MKKWMVLMVAVGFILTVSVSAQADSVLLPWVVKDNAISTIVTLVNTENPPDADTKVRFHLTYWYKRTTANRSLEGCEEVNFCVPTSFNDILVFDAAGNFNGGAPLFGDTSVQGVEYKSVQGKSLALPVDGARRAYLVVTNEVYTNEQCGTAPEGNDGTIYAEAMVVDIANGAAWGYEGYNPDLTDDTNASSNWWYSDLDNATSADRFGEVIESNDGEFGYLTIKPPKAGIISKIFVTPIGRNMWGVGNNFVAIRLYCMLPNNYSSGFPGIYDYDENCISSNATKGVMCTDASPMLDMNDQANSYLTNGAWTVFQNSGAPGWAYLYLIPNAWLNRLNSSIYIGDTEITEFFQPTTQRAVVGKLEYSLGAARFDEKRISSAINNFIWLKGRTRSAD